MGAPWLREKHLTNYTSLQLHFIILSFVSIMIDVCSIRSRPKDRPMGKGISLLHLYLRLDSDKIQGHILTIHRLWLMTHSPRVWWGPVQMTWTTCVETGRGHIPGTNKTSLKRILQSSISSKLSKTIFSQGASHWLCTVPTSCQGGRTCEAEIWSPSPSFHFPNIQISNSSLNV